MALHNQYRPKRLGEVFGQPSVIRILKNAALSGRLFEYQALLFIGSRGCGKTTTARILAHLVNCLNPMDGEPCMECDACKQVSRQLEHGGDIVEVDAASRNKVDDVEKILLSTQYHPKAPLRKKVFILDEAHQLSGAAKDKLLKTLEEPPSHVLFILATTEDHKIPATIASRCIRFTFQDGLPEQIAEYLKTVLEAYGVDYEEEALKKVGALAGGSYRDALGLVEKLIDAAESVSMAGMDEILCLPSRDYIISAAKSVVTGDSAGCIKVAGDVLAQGKNVRLFLKEVNEMLLKRAEALAVNNQSKTPEGLSIPDFLRIGTFIHTQASAYPSELSGLIPGLILAGAASMVRETK